MDDNLIERLEREWQTLAPGPLSERLRAWSRQEPALACFQTPQQLLRSLRALRDEHATTNRILAALLRQAQTDPLAARMVLQALLPGLKNLAGRTLLGAEERDELWASLLAHAWEQIRTYPLEQRPQRIAANLLLDTLKAVTGELKTWRHACAQLHERPLTAAAPAVAHVDGDVERLLARAVAADAISAEEAELILKTRIDGADLHALAREQGLAYHTLEVRRIRAERRLLLYLGHPAVTFRHRKRPLSSARAVGKGPAGSGGGASTANPTPKEVTGAR